MRFLFIAPVIVAFGSWMVYASLYHRPRLPVEGRWESAQRERVKQTLDREVKWKFQGGDLAELASFVESETGVPVELDVANLDGSFNLNVKVSAPLPAMTAKQALTAMLEPHQLAWVPERDRILITTEMEAGTKLIPCVYPVRDLVAADGGADYESLIVLISGAVDPRSWRVTGAGDASIAPHAASGTLVIRQSSANHDEITELLVSLRKARDAQDKGKP
jgi:hypothetical protein